MIMIMIMIRPRRALAGRSFAVVSRSRPRPRRAACVWDAPSVRETSSVWETLRMSTAGRLRITCVCDTA